MIKFKPSEKWLEALGARESGNDYMAENTLGYLGKYQFGAAALVDVGLVNAESYRRWARKGRPGGQKKFLDNPDNWNIEGGKESFFKKPEIQEQAMLDLTERNYQYLVRKGAIQHNFTGTQRVYGLLAAAHLGGPGTALALAKNSDTKFKDAYGTPIEEYYNLGYETV